MLICWMMMIDDKSKQSQSLVVTGNHPSLFMTNKGHNQLTVSGGAEGKKHKSALSAYQLNMGHLRWSHRRQTGIYAGVYLSSLTCQMCGWNLVLLLVSDDNIMSCWSMLPWLHVGSELSVRYEWRGPIGSVEQRRAHHRPHTLRYLPHHVSS